MENLEPQAHGGKLKRGGNHKRTGRPKNDIRLLAAGGAQRATSLLLKRLTQWEQADAKGKPWPAAEVIAIAKILHEISVPKAKVTIDDKNPDVKRIIIEHGSASDLV